MVFLRQEHTGQITLLVAFAAKNYCRPSPVVVTESSPVPAPIARDDELGIHGEIDVRPVCGERCVVVGMRHSGIDIPDIAVGLTGDTGVENDLVDGELGNLLGGRHRRQQSCRDFLVADRHRPPVNVIIIPGRLKKLADTYWVRRQRCQSKHQRL